MPSLKPYRKCFTNFCCDITPGEFGVGLVHSAELRSCESFSTPASSMHCIHPCEPLRVSELIRHLNGDTSSRNFSDSAPHLVRALSTQAALHCLTRRWGAAGAHNPEEHPRCRESWTRAHKKQDTEGGRADRTALFLCPADPTKAQFLLANLLGRPRCGVCVAPGGGGACMVSWRSSHLVLLLPHFLLPAPVWPWACSNFPNNQRYSNLLRALLSIGPGMRPSPLLQSTILRAGFQN